MTLNEMIEILESLKEELGGDEMKAGEVEVRIATQQSYPLQSSVYGIARLTEAEPRDYEEGTNPRELRDIPDFVDGPPREIIYICEGNQDSDMPYANRDLWDASRRY